GRSQQPLGAACERGSARGGDEPLLARSRARSERSGRATQSRSRAQADEPRDYAWRLRVVLRRDRARRQVDQARVWCFTATAASGGEDRARASRNHAAGGEARGEAADGSTNQEVEKTTSDTPSGTSKEMKNVATGDEATGHGAATGSKDGAEPASKNGAGG